MNISLTRPYLISDHVIMKTLFIVLLLFCSQSAIAQNWYRVELIVFKDLNPLTGGEHWGKYPGLPDTANSVELIRGQEGDPPGEIAFQTLDKSKLTLSGTYATLSKSSQYRPLTYLAWQQPALDANRSRAVKVTINQQDTQPLVSGNINIRSSVYLHVDLDLAFFLPDTVNQQLDDAEQGVGQSAVRKTNAVTRLTETRRVKLNEIHYFDHPLFGAIVRVVRLGR